jgi:hypothetical protein
VWEDDSVRLFRILQLLCLGWSSALFGACTETLPATQALIVVYADTQALASELSALRIQLFPVGATDDAQAIERRTIALTADQPGDGKYKLPFSFGIEKIKASRFLLVITGYRKMDTEPVIEHKLIASFLDRQTALIEVVLSEACYERASACASLDQTCYPEAYDSIEAGSCGPVRSASVHPVLAGQELDASSYTPSASDLDAGTDSGEVNEDEPADSVATEGGAAEISPEDDAGTRNASDAASPDASPGVCAMPESACQHAGQCRELPAGRSCDCSAVDYEGDSCETKIDDCARTPCAAFEECHDGVRTRSCRCPLGFGGTMCEAIDPLEVAFVGDTTAELAQFEAWLGRPLDGVFVSTYGNDWTEYESLRRTRIARWAAVDRRIFWTIGLLVPGATLAEAGNGAYDAYYRAAAQDLSGTRPQDPEIFISTGFAFNLAGRLWSAQGKTAEFIAAYRRFVTVFRSVSSRFVFQWGMALGDQGMDPATAYPGDEYVDFIAMNLYYDTAYLPTDPDQAWDIVFNQAYGLAWLEQFAATHQKRMVFPEWAVNTDSAGRFIEQAEEWFETSPVVYHSYWNRDDSIASKLSDDRYPAAGAAYRAAFGP